MVESVVWRYLVRKTVGYLSEQDKLYTDLGQDGCGQQVATWNGNRSQDFDLMYVCWVGTYSGALTRRARSTQHLRFTVRGAHVSGQSLLLASDTQHLGIHHAPRVIQESSMSTGEGEYLDAMTSGAPRSPRLGLIIPHILAGVQILKRTSRCPVAWQCHDHGAIWGCAAAWGVEGRQVAC